VSVLSARRPHERPGGCLPGHRQRRRLALLSALVLGAAQVACTGSGDDVSGDDVSGDEGTGREETGDEGSGDDVSAGERSDDGGEGRSDLGFEPAPDGPSWAPRPEDLDGLSAVATVDGDRFVLHTEHGEVDFLPGVTLGSTVPGRNPGGDAVTGEDVRGWLPLMGQMGFRSLRVYTIMPPAFYEELAAYNTENGDTPIYLVHDLTIGSERYVETGDLYDGDFTAAYGSEIADTVAAVHGDLARDPAPGQVSGRWTADVSPWLAGWIVGAELDPLAVAASDEANAEAPPHEGEYFATTDDATPTVRWLAARMEEVAAADAERGHAAPVAFMNWSPLDPLTHPAEPLEENDLVGLDANTVEATDAWPAGTFASYHAYPYYPDFLRFEPGLRMSYDGRTDPYAGYLRDLEDHHPDMPVLVTEFGVPSALGAAHAGPLGRHQGNLSEQRAMAIDAEMLRMIHDLGLDGAFLFAWADEWFKPAWNTRPRHIPPNRRRMWRDVLTVEEHYGVIATDAAGGDDATPKVLVDGDDVTVRAASDPSWVHLEIELAGGVDEPIVVAFDVVDGGAELPGSAASDGTADYAVVIDPDAGKAQAWVRAELDPVQYDGLPPADRPPVVDGWAHQQMALSPPLVIPTTGEQVPAELFDVGTLRHGEMEPERDGYDSRNTWRLDGSTLTLRIPWGLLGIADPSSKQALVPASPGEPTAVDVDVIGLTIAVGDRRIDTPGITWSPWQAPDHVERVKAGVQAYVDAQYDVTPR
jgi:hypothetical protein